MSLDKSIKSGKEHRKPYYGSKAFDPACANGSCPHCKNNKTHKIKKTILKAEAQVKQNEEV